MLKPGMDMDFQKKVMRVRVPPGWTVEQTDLEEKTMNDEDYRKLEPELTAISSYLNEHNINKITVFEIFRDFDMRPYYLKYTQKPDQIRIAKVLRAAGFDKKGRNAAGSIFVREPASETV